MKSAFTKFGASGAIALLRHRPTAGLAPFGGNVEQVISGEPAQ
jgi:hypothetical protein